MDKCVRCKGRGKVSMDTGRKGGRPLIPCPVCGGSGEVASEQTTWLMTTEQMADRIHELESALQRARNSCICGWTEAMTASVKTPKQSALGKAVEIARGQSGPPTEPVHFAAAPQSDETPGVE